MLSRFQQNRNDRIGTLVARLMKSPLKETHKRMPRNIAAQPGANMMADLLFLPNDNSYRYALVVVDTATRVCDAYPLKSKAVKEIINAFKAIFKGRHLDDENLKLMRIDAGKEFKGEVPEYFTHRGVGLKVSRVNRHRQTSLVEAMNKVIGQSIFQIQHEEEIRLYEAGDPQQVTSWVVVLPYIIKNMNDYLLMNVLLNPPVRNEPTDVVCAEHKDAEKNTCLLYDIGQKVHVMLDYPRDTYGNRLIGKFRATDLKWERTPRTTGVSSKIWSKSRKKKQIVFDLSPSFSVLSSHSATIPRPVLPI